MFFFEDVQFLVNIDKLEDAVIRQWQKLFLASVNKVVNNPVQGVSEAFKEFLHFEVIIMVKFLLHFSKILNLI